MGSDPGVSGFLDRLTALVWAVCKLIWVLALSLVGLSVLALTVVVSYGIMLGVVG